MGTFLGRSIPIIRMAHYNNRHGPIYTLCYMEYFIPIIRMIISAPNSNLFHPQGIWHFFNYNLKAYNQKF